MNLRPTLIVSLLLGVACGPKDEADTGGSGSDSTGSTGASATMTDGSASASTTATTASTSASTTDTTGIMTSSQDSTASETTAADSGSTGQADSGGSSSGGAGSSSGGGEGLYGMCEQGDPQCPGDQQCVEIMMGNLNFCTVPCTMDEECPAPTSGDAVPSCSGPPMADTRCQLDCSGGATCPDGMMCQMLGGGGFGLCVWTA